MGDERAYRPNQWVQVGALDRGWFRLSLAKAGIEYTETKSLLCSVFRLKVSPTHWAQLRKKFEALA
jgi:hypothetical protein